jgi:hypothetical protein
MSYLLCRHWMEDPVEFFGHLNVRPLYDSAFTGRSPLEDQRWQMLNVLRLIDAYNGDIFSDRISARPDRLISVLGLDTLLPESRQIWVLERCLLNTPPFSTASFKSLRDDRIPPQELRCRNWQRLIGQLAHALLVYEASWHAAEEPQELRYFVREILGMLVEHIVKTYQYLPQALHTRRTLEQLKRWSRDTKAFLSVFEVLPDEAFDALPTFPRSFLPDKTENRRRLRLLQGLYGALEQFGPDCPNSTRYRTMAILLDCFGVYNARGGPLTPTTIERALHRALSTDR